MLENPLSSLMTWLVIGIALALPGILYVMLNNIADDAVQIFGGMGLMEEMPIQRFWRDSRLERIWDGTSEIQRHIITRSILRPLGA